MQPSTKPPPCSPAQAWKRLLSFVFTSATHRAGPFPRPHVLIYIISLATIFPSPTSSDCQGKGQHYHSNTHQSPRSFNHVSRKSSTRQEWGQRKSQPSPNFTYFLQPCTKCRTSGISLLNLHLRGSTHCPLEDPSAAIADLSRSAISWTLKQF